mmetsp:Transcript_16018/g.27017  ORF Transcript_16018/g.27017 Transcript_16018/m.27017 type:complete len:242 (+) Transcript_16018:1103-1828(+)
MDGTSHLGGHVHLCLHHCADHQVLQHLHIRPHPATTGEIHTRSPLSVLLDFLRMASQRGPWTARLPMAPRLLPLLPVLLVHHLRGVSLVRFRLQVRRLGCGRGWQDFLRGSDELLPYLPRADWRRDHVQLAAVRVGESAGRGSIHAVSHCRRRCLCVPARLGHERLLPLSRTAHDWSMGYQHHAVHYLLGVRRYSHPHVLHQRVLLYANVPNRLEDWAATAGGGQGDQILFLTLRLTCLQL